MINLLLFLNLFSLLQKDILVNQQHDFFETDHLGSIYFINDTELVKRDFDGNKLASYSNSMLGEISSIDVSDPLRIMVFHKDFNQIEFLNNDLSAIGSTIDLFDYNENDTELSCTSQKGGFWIYNSIDQQAFHFNSLGKLVNESILLIDFFEEEMPVQMVEFDNQIFLLYENEGLLVLDENGQFLQKHQIKDIQTMQLQSQNHTLYYSTREGIFKYNFKNREAQLIFSFENKANVLWKIHNEIVYLSNKKSISIKKLNF